VKQWIRVRTRNGRRIAVCDVCGAAAGVPTRLHLNSFATKHKAHQSAQRGWMGAGDVVHAAASKLGIETCTPCEKRRRKMNRMMPKFWRR